MGLRFKIEEIALEKGIKNAAELAREAKIGQATAYDLWDNKRSDANYSTLMQRARVFFGLAILCVYSSRCWI